MDSSGLRAQRPRVGDEHPAYAPVGVWYLYLTYLPPHLICVNALPCETQMLQIVTLRGDYLYQMAHLCIINSAESATWFDHFNVLNILCRKQQTTK